MADRGTIPARTTIASMPTVMPKTQTRRVKNCCQTGHSARTRDLSPPRSRFTFGFVFTIVIAAAGLRCGLTKREVLIAL
jgi:hypothetical protein